MTTMAAKRTSTTTAPSRLTVKVPKWSLAPSVEAARRNPLFARGEDVEVRRSLGQVFGGRELVIYVRAKVVSASPGTYSYLVEYPAAGPFPIRTARVAAFDVRAARRFPPPDSRPGSSKRPLPSEQPEGDSCKKAKIGIGKGIPKDVLERLIAEHEKEEEAKKKALGQRGELPARKLMPASVKVTVARTKVAAPEKNKNVTVMAAKRSNTALLRPAMFQYKQSQPSTPHARTVLTRP
jgi:hypothetical protein